MESCFLIQNLILFNEIDRCVHISISGTKITDISRMRHTWSWSNNYICNTLYCRFELKYLHCYCCKILDHICTFQQSRIFGKNLIALSQWSWPNNFKYAICKFILRKNIFYTLHFYASSCLICKTFSV